MNHPTKHSSPYIPGQEFFIPVFGLVVLPLLLTLSVPQTAYSASAQQIGDSWGGTVGEI